MSKPMTVAQKRFREYLARRAGITVQELDQRDLVASRNARSVARATAWNDAARLGWRRCQEIRERLEAEDAARLAAGS